MTYLDLAIAALYQGLALVWPVSGDVAARNLFHWASDPVFAPLLKSIGSVGSGLALTLILNREIYEIFRSAVLAAKGRQEGSVHPLLMLALGSLPLVAVDLFGDPKPEVALWLEAAFVLAGGLALLAADKLGVTIRDLDHLSQINYLVIGLLQALGNVFGVTTLIVAIILGRLMGCERDQSIKLAWLFLIPHLLFGLCGIVTAASPPPVPEAVLVGALSFAAALTGGAMLLAWLRRKGFTAFAVAQIVIGAVLILSVTGFGG